MRLKQARNTQHKSALRSEVEAEMARKARFSSAEACVRLGTLFPLARYDAASAKALRRPRGCSRCPAWRRALDRLEWELELTAMPEKPWAWAQSVVPGKTRGLALGPLPFSAQRCEERWEMSGNLTA
ncbi:hypothetical protein NDU88_011499 [Pleurodeles waltl]|uniref:Uncharacterized protein n=1 Tax=Pleurodeles waltl TaxID=8319 RepID=A0AAV7QYS2_PLEWA|nr:hypothetical protein NDU88_011499 [Pleurodeles waltl]